MKSWMQERDLLIAETMAFVEGVAASTATPLKAAIAAAIATAPPDQVRKAEQPSPVEPGLVETPPQPIARLTPLPIVDERAEITRRIASFKAHQARFFQGRDKFFRSEMAKIGDMLGSDVKGKSF